MFSQKGLGGGFGELVAGKFWNNLYNWTYSGSDIANNYSGWFTYTALHPARSTQSLQYTTPDLNGFQGSILISAKDTSSKLVTAKAPSGLC